MVYGRADFSPPAEPGPAYSRDEQPLFILSCHRSGSTLLRYILDTHPDIYSPPELFLGRTAASLATLYCGLEGTTFQAAKIDDTSQQVLERIRSLIADEMKRQARLRGKRFWCEKTPTNLVHLNLLDTLFPEARYICLYRHGLDVAHSALKMIDGIPELYQFAYQSQGHLPTAALSYWSERTATLLNFEAEHPTRCHRMRYEDLVSAPREALGSLFSFLGMEWDEQIVDSVFSTHHDHGVEDHYVRFSTSIHARSIGGGEALSLEGVPEKTVRSMEALLQTLRYPARTAPTGSPSLPPETDLDAPPSLEWFFETHLAQKLQGVEPVPAGSYQFLVGGKEGGAWWVDLRQEGGCVVPGRWEADCTIEMAGPDLIAVAQGRLHARKALEERKIILRGDFESQALEVLLRLLRLDAAASYR